MNSFGRLFRISIFGESHGSCVGVLIDGCPAGLSLSVDDMLPDLERRKPNARGTTERKESDMPILKSGIFNGKTTGAPILIEFENKNIDSSAYEKIKETPRPGHADFVANKKFGAFNDTRGGGYFSGRLTAGFVAAGVIAKKILVPITINAEILEVGGSKDINQILEAAMKSGDSVGGVIECKASNVSIGLGEPFFDSVESLISHIVFSIPAIRGIEFGAGFGCTNMKGSECNDELLTMSGKTKTNNAGGINGGITNGNDIVFRVAVKPTSSIQKAQSTVNIKTGAQTEISIDGRHDTCIAFRVPVILEAVTAIVLADLMLLEQKIPRIIK